MLLKANQTLLFIGNSITDCGRTRPVGMGNNGLGDGYVKLAHSLFSANHPDIPLRILNTGISGNRVTDLYDRWDNDVMELRPDWLSVKIGINDVWRQFDNPTDPAPVTIEIYEKTYRQLLEKTRPQLSGLVLISPFFLEANQCDPMRQQMNAYGAVVKQLTGEFDAIFVDVQAAFDAYLKALPTQTLCSDRVHPNQTGHLIIAQAFFNALGGIWKR